MNSLGRYNPGTFLINPLTIDTGLGWEYLRVINNSPYLLKVGLGGQGTIDFPEMFLEDIPTKATFNGKLSIAPFANFTQSTIAKAISNLISINAYQPGELKQPIAQPIGSISTVSNAAAAFQTSFVSVVSLDVSAAFNTAQSTLLPSAAFPNMNLVSPQQPGFLFLGYLRSSNARELIVPYRNGFREAVSSFQTVMIPNAGGTQTFQLTNANAITSIQVYNFSNPVATVGIDTISFDKNDGNSFPAGFLPEITGANPGIYSFVNQFGPYGVEGYSPSAGGNRILLHFFNTTGAQVNCGLIITGSRFAFDDALLQVAFADWASPANTYTLGFIRLGSVDQLPLNFLVPTPITNSGQTTFGKLIYTVYNVTEFYSTQFLVNKYTMDTIIPANLIIPGTG